MTGPGRSGHPAPARGLRAGVFTAVGVGLAAAAHLSAGGATPRLFVLLAALALGWPLAYAASRRERGGLFLGVTVVGSQLLLHAVFALTGRVPAPPPGAGPAQATSWAGLLFCHHGGAPVCAAQVASARAALGLTNATLPTAGTVPTAGAPFPTAGAGPSLASMPLTAAALGMLAAHLAAALLTAWWLRRGEQAVWSAARWAAAAVAARLRRPAGHLPGPIRRLRLVVVANVRPRPELRWACLRPERGPPVPA